MQDRLRSKFLWLAVIALVAFILGNWGLYEAIGLNAESFQTFADLILGVFIALGIINNPTDAQNW